MKDKKIKIQKKYIAFFVIVPLLIATAFVGLPCPVCDGTGTVSSTGTTGVQIKKLNYRETSTYIAACEVYRAYLFHIDVDLDNTSETDTAEGWIAFNLVASGAGTIIDTKYGLISLKPMESGTYGFDATFFVDFSVDESNATYITAQVIKGDVADNACNGTGRVSLNEFFLKQYLSDSYTSEQKAFRPYVPPFEETSEALPIDIFDF